MGSQGPGERPILIKIDPAAGVFLEAALETLKISIIIVLPTDVLRVWGSTGDLFQ